MPNYGARKFSYLGIHWGWAERPSGLFIAFNGYEVDIHHATVEAWSKAELYKAMKTVSKEISDEQAKRETVPSGPVDSTDNTAG
jgi:hypothetical protein